jgi:uncharacterized protein (TIGR00288 family)
MNYMQEKQYLRRERGEAQIAVLIDFENVGLDSIQFLFDEISNAGRIIVKRAYADWATESKRRDQILALGIEPIHLFRTTSGGKNASDIRLAIDAIALLYTSPVDTFVIVSSDSDFVPLTSKLRSEGKTVIGAGRRAIASRTLITACDSYVYLDIPESTKKSTLSKPKQSPSLLVRAFKRTFTKNKSADQPNFDELLLRALDSSIDREGGVRGAKLHQAMIRLDPSFDFRALGFKTFAQFLEPNTKIKISRSGGQRDVTVELAPTATSRASKVSKSNGQRDVTIELAPTATSRASTDLPLEWANQIDIAWSKRIGEFLPGPWAASRAARVFGVSKLSVSPFKTLQELLDASNYLASKWARDGNRIVKK